MNCVIMRFRKIDAKAVIVNVIPHDITKTRKLRGSAAKTLNMDARIFIIGDYISLSFIRTADDRAVRITFYQYAVFLIRDIIHTRCIHANRIIRNPV